MTNLTPVASFDSVPQLETSTLALGGVGGPMNLPLQALLNRTQWLHDNAVAGGSGPYIAAGGTANAITASYVPPVASLADGLKLRFTAAAANTGPTTFAPDAIGAQPVLGGAFSALQGGEIAANSELEVVWNATLSAWVLISQAGGSPQVPNATQSQHPVSKGQLADGATAGNGGDMVAFAQSGTGAVVRTSQKKQRERVTWLDFIPVTEHAAILAGTSTYDSSAAIQAAIDSGAKTVIATAGKYRITAQGLSIANKTGFTFISEGAILDINGAITGLSISGCDGFRSFGELIATGLSTATGYSISNNIRSSFAGFNAIGLATAGVALAPQSVVYGGNTVPDRTRLGHFTAIACNLGWRIDGEYYEMVSPHIVGCATIGLHVRGGNFSGTGGSVLGNRIGLWVQGGVIANSDHGRVAGMTINHNLAANVYLTDLLYTFHISSCDMWAAVGDGTANGQLSEEGRTTSFGVYMRNCNNVNLASNTIARNLVNVGIDGACLTNIVGNNLIADTTRTTSHIKEYGANNTTFSKNAQNLYAPNAFHGALFGGGTRWIETLDTVSSVAHRTKGSVGTTSDHFELVDNTVTGAYVYYGKADTLGLNSNSTATVSISPALFQSDFRILFSSISGGSKAITVTGANAITAMTSGASVSGTTVTFSASGLYLFSSTGNGVWVVTCASGNEVVQAPTLLNSWTNLAGFQTVGFWRDTNGDVVLRGTLATTGATNTAAFTLPAGYRPAASIAMPAAMDTGKSGFVRVDSDGSVRPNFESAATFVGLTGLRFRVA